MSKRTPWGVADYEEHILGDDIIFYGTPSHGGIKLSPKFNKLVHPAFRNDDKSWPAWYEEDVDIAIVMLTFPQAFLNNDTNKYDPVKVLKDYFPDKWEQMTGQRVMAHESHVIRDREFKGRNLGKYVCLAAWGDWHEKVPNGFVGVVASIDGIRGTNNKKYFLVPKNEYKIPFAIDESRHQIWEGPN